MTTITADRAGLEELLGEYWEIAFEESSGVAATGNKANRVLHEIRALFDVKQAEIARLKAESEERLQNCAALDRPDARPHRYRVQGNDAWNHYGTRGQAMTTREAFEDWYEVDCYPCEHSNWFRLDSDGDYALDEVQSAWRTWQAATAAALAAKPSMPAWHDAPTVPGLWVHRQADRNQRKPLTYNQIWDNDDIMAANAEADLLLSELVTLVRAVEKAHGIT